MTTLETTTVITAALVVAVCACDIMRQRRRMKLLRVDYAAKEKEMSERLAESTERNRQLTEDYRRVSKELLRHSMGFMHHSTFLNQIIKELREASSGDKTKMVTASKSVTASLSQYDDTIRFLSANNIMRGPLEALRLRMKEDEPSLTPETIELAVWIRLGFSKRDIMTATGKKAQTLQMTRYRLRKALNLTQYQNLYEYLKQRWPELPEGLCCDDTASVDMD